MDSGRTGKYFATASASARAKKTKQDVLDFPNPEERKPVIDEVVLLSNCQS